MNGITVEAVSPYAYTPAMDWERTKVPGAWVFTPTIHGDSRGVFLESFTAQSLSKATGLQFDLAQINVSVSSRGVVRGLHACRVPPGQAKYVQCVVGEVIDVVVDINPASTTFGQFDSVMLNDMERRAIFVGEGLAHGFCVRSESATLVYATSSPYNPEAEFAIHPLDPDLAIPWAPGLDLSLSEKDMRAPSLREAVLSGLIFN